MRVRRGNVVQRLHAKALSLPMVRRKFCPPWLVFRRMAVADLAMACAWSAVSRIREDAWA